MLTRLSYIPTALEPVTVLRRIFGPRKNLEGMGSDELTFYNVHLKRTTTSIIKGRSGWDMEPHEKQGMHT